MPFKIDPEVGAALQALFADQQPKPTRVGDYMGFREAFNGVFQIMVPASNLPKDVTVKEFTAKSYDGAEIPLRWYLKESSKPDSAILYFHGGGMVSGSALLYEAKVGLYASLSGVPFLSVDYRLAPEHPAPTPVEDAYAALVWLHEHAKELGVDPKKIAIMGDSAGGGIAASLTHLAKHRGGPGIAKQILVYPMLDDRNITPDKQLGPLAVVTAEGNETGWNALLGERRGTERVLPTDAPARMTDATGLPPLYVDVGDLDIYRNESIEYAAKFGRAGINAELHVYPGCPHGFDNFAPNAKVTQAAIGNRLRAIATIEPLD